MKTPRFRSASPESARRCACAARGQRSGLGVHLFRLRHTSGLSCFSQSAPAIGYNGEMREQPPCPWIRSPDLLRDRHPSQESLAQFTDWLKFVYALSPDELVGYERDHPAPAGWEEFRFYERAARWHDLREKLPGAMQSVALVQKMWQTTTLK